MHLYGVPLVATQADLTETQKEFLQHALPRAHASLQGDSPEHKTQSAVSEETKRAAKRRRATN